MGLGSREAPEGNPTGHFPRPERAEQRDDVASSHPEIEGAIHAEADVLNAASNSENDHVTRCNCFVTPLLRFVGDVRCQLIVEKREQYVERGNLASQLQFRRYNELWQRFDDGIISMASMKKWYDVNFDGMYDERLLTAAVKHKCRWIYDDIYKALNKESEVIVNGRGCVAWDANSIIRSPVKGHFKNEIQTEIKNKVLGGVADDTTIDDFWTSSQRQFIHWIWPDTSAQLAVRCRINMVAALYVLAKSKLTIEQKMAVWNIVKGGYGLGKQAATNIVLICVLNPKLVQLFTVMNQKFGVFKKGLKYCTEVFKAIHTFVRITNQTVLPMFNLKGDEYQMSDLIYLNCMIGRYMFEHNYKDDELMNRQEYNPPKLAVGDDGIWSEEAYRKYFDDEMYVVSRTMALSTQRVMRDMDMTQMYARFLQCGTSGAAKQGRKKTFVHKGREYKLSGCTKTAYLMSLDTKILQQVLDSKPKQRTTAVVKCEAGKSRLLLPGQLEHWMLESIILSTCEARTLNLIPKCQLTLNKFDFLREMLVRMQSLSEGQAAVDSDYADFNILHDVPDMKKMWQDAGDMLAGLKMQDDDVHAFCVDAYRWIAQSLMDRKIGGVRSHQWYTMVRGLWTGWRSTTFINTMFNHLYLRVIVKSFKNTYGYDPLLRQSLLGDDMEGNTFDQLTCVRLLAMIPKHGLDAQPLKQLVSEVHTEFLRNFYSARKIEGSLNRNVFQTTSGDLQTSPVHKGAAAAYNIHAICMRWLRRGGDYDGVKIVHDAMTENQFRIVVFDRSTTQATKKIFKPDMRILKINVANGGLGCVMPNEATIDNLAVRWPSIPEKSEAIQLARRVYDEQKGSLPDKAIEAQRTAFHKMNVVCHNMDEMMVRAGGNVLIQELPGDLGALDVLAVPVVEKYEHAVKLPQHMEQEIVHVVANVIDDLENYRLTHGSTEPLTYLHSLRSRAFEWAPQVSEQAHGFVRLDGQPLSRYDLIMSVSDRSTCERVNAIAQCFGQDVVNEIINNGHKFALYDATIESVAVNTVIEVCCSLLADLFRWQIQQSRNRIGTYQSICQAVEYTVRRLIELCPNSIIAGMNLY